MHSVLVSRFKLLNMYSLKIRNSSFSLISSDLIVKCSIFRCLIDLSVYNYILLVSFFSIHHLSHHGILTVKWGQKGIKRMKNNGYITGGRFDTS